MKLYWRNLGKEIYSCDDFSPHFLSPWWRFHTSLYINRIASQSQLTNIEEQTRRAMTPTGAPRPKDLRSQLHLLIVWCWCDFSLFFFLRFLLCFVCLFIVAFDLFGTLNLCFDVTHIRLLGFVSLACCSSIAVSIYDLLSLISCMPTMLAVKLFHFLMLHLVLH